MYVRTAGGTDANKFGVGFDCYWNGGTGSTNITCTNNIFHDMSSGAFFDYAPSSAAFEMSFCTAYNINWGGAAGDHSSSSTLNGLLVHDCYFYNWQSWSSSDAGVQAALHHNGFYGWAESGGALTNVTFYNNFCGPGYTTTQASAGLFVSGNAGGILIYDNTLIADSTGTPGDGLIFVWVHNGNQTGARIYNNTMVGAGFGNGIDVYSGNGPSITTYDIKNNLIVGMGTAIARFNSGDSTLTADNNLGYNLLSGQAYSNSSNASANFMAFAQWQSAGFDTHGSSGNPNLNGSYVPQAPSAAIGSGINLSSFFTTDMAGNSRPASPAAWDIGAIQSGSVSSPAPVITTQPTSQTVATGGSVTFTVAASGTPAPTFQWQKGGANIPGATGTTFTLNNVTPADAATYTAVATNSAGSTTSNGAVLTVTGTPIITTQPTSFTVQTGVNVTFTVSASGIPAPTFQWRKNGANISGATGATLTLNNVTPADAATYSAVATNSAGSVASNGALLTVTSVPVITTQPTSQTVTTGANVTFTTGASGTPAPTFQWQKNGSPIIGATGATLTLTSVTTADAATYTAVATNSAGSATSNGAVLTVATASSAPIITTQPTSVMVGTGANVTFTVGASGIPAPTFQWRKNGANISGATSVTFALVGVTSADAATYTAVATNSAGSATSNGAVLTVILNAPVITAQPASQTVATGANVTFTVSASGTPAPTFQWRKNGSAISGATGATLTLNSITSADAATYTVVASNVAGTATSNGAVLTVTGSSSGAPVITTQPTSQSVATGASVTFTVAVSGTAPFSYQWKFNGNAISGATSSSFTINNAQSANAGIFSVTVGNAAGTIDSIFVSLIVGTGNSTAYLEYPTGVAIDIAGNLYVVDASKNVVQKISGGQISTLAGTPGVAGPLDGSGAAAQFNQPTGIAIDPFGNIIVADSGNGTIRKITSSGTVTTLAGSSSNRGNVDGTGTTAQFNKPTGVAANSVGDLFVADAFADTIRRITASSLMVTTLAGANGVRGNTDGTGSAALFNQPANVALDAAGNIYVADAFNDLIRKITPSGVVTTLAGLDGVSGFTDGTGINALFNQPFGIAVDSAGNVFVADTGNSIIRKITPAGVVVTIAGLPGVAGFKDGPAISTAEFNQPHGLCVDASENIYIADTGNGVIRKIDSSGNATTLIISATSDASTRVNPPSVTSSGAGASTSGSAQAAASSGGGGGGGGAMEPWFICTLAMLALARRSLRRPGRT